MFKVSTYFIKEQIHNVSIRDLITLYKQELEIQSVNNIADNGDTIDFRNKVIKFVLNRYADKFSSFSSGQIKIVDEGNEFGVHFKADWTRMFTSAGLLAGIVTILSFFSIGFKIFCLFVGLGVFALLVIIGFISTSISFPIYFTSLRNKIEQELQEG
ncbi:MAG TPA: hypothetical protein VIJ92_13825 [Ginsengibacter sp.]